MAQKQSISDLPVLCVNHVVLRQDELLLPKPPLTYRVKPKIRYCVCIPSRFMLTLWTFLGLLVAYALRANLSVAIVSMVQTSSSGKNTNSSLVCSNQYNFTNWSKTDGMGQDGEFDWDDKTRGIILGAFFYGYIITQIPGGLLAERFGGKWFFGGGILITSIATILTPLAARFHVSTLIIVRFIAGLGEGVTFPSYFALYSHWIPHQEHSRILAITNSGSHLGNIIAMPATAWLCEHGFDGGWPSVFYIFGTVGCFWFVLWALFVFDRPENHPYISPSELTYIRNNRELDKKAISWSIIPWKKILTSFPVWALAAAKFSGSWSYYTMMTELPTFLNEVLNYPIEENGFLNSLLYAAIAVSIIVAGTSSDLIRAWGYYSVTAIRKIFQSIGTFGSAIILTFIPSMGCNHGGVIALLITSMLLTGFNAGGEAPTALDMSPKYVGIIFGIANCFGNASGILAPLAVGYITNGDESDKNWNYVFYLASTINIIGGTAFMFFGSASHQSWSSADSDLSSSDKRDK